MKIAIAQLNFTVGNLDTNVEKIVAASSQAHQQGAELLVTSELALSGYSPEDLLLRPRFLKSCQQALLTLAKRIPHSITVIVGHPEEIAGRCFNTATIIHEGNLVASYRKMKLPNDSVFDEMRYFSAGDTPCVYIHYTKSGYQLPLGIVICEDLWDPYPIATAKKSGARLIIAINASPFHANKSQQREQLVQMRCQENAIPIIYCNAVGGQDELVFDGQSFAIDAQQEIVMRMPAFEEVLGYIYLHEGALLSDSLSPILSEEASIYQALVLSVRDYLQKNHFAGAILGLSGGIDSALTLAIACDAIGAANVYALMMPSVYTADISIEDARQMAKKLDVKYDEISIQSLFTHFLQTLAPVFSNQKSGITEENLQARIRGTVLMAISNKTGHIVLATGNKSEMGTGYTTLYGDMVGGFAVLKDISKTLVYRLAHYRNNLSYIIPERIINRPPSAELREHQVDQDSLPPYSILDKILSGYMEYNLEASELINQGLPEIETKKVIHLLKINEYKRRQAPIGPRITARAYGKDWRYPITNGFNEEVIE